MGTERRVLVVGAGFAGAVHARELADRGFRVDVIDRRPHLAGNAHDAVTAEGVRVHRYGPHLFHTSNAKVFDWVSRFGVFVPYHHKVEAELADGRCVPLPINRATINAVFGVALATQEEVRAFIARQAEPVARVQNAYQHLVSEIGRTLTDLFFRPYTRKMWGMDLDALSADVVKRIPIRYDDEDRYFPGDTYQVLPRDGYTNLFERIFDHDRISVALSLPFDTSMLPGYFHCFNSMPIDEFFGFDDGTLPYRSIRFHHRAEPGAYARGHAAVVNFTDDRMFTRETDWGRLPRHRAHGTNKTITLEEPCDYRDNDFERYYPVKTSDGANDAIYRRYKARADALPGMSFIGRCGTYQYLDMHQVINQSLAGVAAWLERVER